MISTNYDTSLLKVVQMKNEAVPEGTQCVFCLQKLFNTAIKNKESLYACVDCVPEGSNNMGKIKYILNKQEGSKNQALNIKPFSDFSDLPDLSHYFGKSPHSNK